MSFTIYAVAALAVLAASFFTTVSGFGFALIALPLLTCVLSVKTAIILVLVLSIAARIFNMLQTRSSWQGRVVFTLFLGSMVGALPGALALKYLPMAQAELLLGGVIVVAAFFMNRHTYFPVKNKKLGRLAAGFVSGLFGTATGVSGPPIVLYCLNEGMEKTAMRSNMIWYFGLQSFFTLLVNYWAGNTKTVTDWLLLAALLPAMFLGVVLGNRAFKKIDQALFQKLALAAVAAGGVSLLVHGLL